MIKEGVITRHADDVILIVQRICYARSICCVRNEQRYGPVVPLHSATPAIPGSFGPANDVPPVIDREGVTLRRWRETVRRWGRRKTRECSECVGRATPHSCAVRDFTVIVPHHSATFVNGHRDSGSPQALGSAAARPEDRLRWIGILRVACDDSLVVYTKRIATLFGAEGQLVHCTAAVLVEERVSGSVEGSAIRLSCVPHHLVAIVDRCSRHAPTSCNNRWDFDECILRIRGRCPRRGG